MEKHEKEYREQKKRKKEQRLRGRSILAVLFLSACVLTGGLTARYIHTMQSDSGQVTSRNFYFTADLLGDTKMVPTEGNTEESYAFGEESTEGTWQLYGGSTHSTEIQIQNYYDKERITEGTIEGNVSIKVKDPDGSSITGTGDNFPSVGQTSFTLAPASSGEMTAQPITLNIPDTASWNYADQTVVTVEITSTRPYKKTLTLNFELYASDINLKYRMVDSVGSPYAELILMTNVEAGTGVQPTLIWPDALSIDDTNKLTFTYSGSDFIQESGLIDRNMQISEPLAAGRSESIYFFKKDPSKNYTIGDTVVPEMNGAYVINLREKLSEQ